MAPIGKIDAVYREKTSPVEAVKLYTDINRRTTTTADNPFKGSNSMGLFMGNGYDFSTGNQKFGFTNTLGYKLDPNDGCLKEVNSTQEWVA